MSTNKETSFIKEPCADAFNIFEPIFKFKGIVTDQGSRIENYINRPRFNRVNRAEQLKTVLELRKQISRQGISFKDKSEKTKEIFSKANNIFDEARQEDSLIKQYLNQRTIEITMPEIGTLSSKFTIIEPLTPSDQVPIFFIPGRGNDLDCVGSLLVELAKNGRKVICVAAPESYQGSTTKEFLGKLKHDYFYNNHKKFFKEALKAIVPDEKVELWSLSMGTGISQQLLLDKEIQYKVTKSTLICPTNLIELNLPKFIAGCIKDYSLLLRKYSRIWPRWVFTIGKKENRNEIMNEDNKMIAIPFKRWSEIKTPLDIFIADKDGMTYGYLADRTKIMKNQNIKTYLFPGIHETPALNPKFLLKYINAHQKLNS